MTMHLNLSDEMEGFIRGKVAGGMYGNATEVIRDAVRRMQAEEARVAAWQAAIKVGEDQLAAGQGTTYTPELLDKISERAKKAMGTETALNPDVLPEDHLEGQLLAGLQADTKAFISGDWQAIRKEVATRVEKARKSR